MGQYVIEVITKWCIILSTNGYLGNSWASSCFMSHAVYSMDQ